VADYVNFLTHTLTYSSGKLPAKLLSYSQSSEASDYTFKSYSTHNFDSNEIPLHLGMLKEYVKWLGDSPELDHGLTIEFFYNIYNSVKFPSSDLALHLKSSPNILAEVHSILLSVLRLYKGRMKGFPVKLSKHMLSVGSTHHEVAVFESTIAHG
jgi:hypothetical protein